MTKTQHEPIIKLALVDDDTLVIQLLTDFLEANGPIKVVLTASSGNQFIEKMRNATETPDVVVLDLRMAEGTGLEVMSELQKQETTMKVIVLSTFYKPSFIGQMLRLGADAFLPKEVDQEELIDVIKGVQEKGHYFSEDQVSVMRKQLSTKTPQFHLPNKDGLTEREIEVIQLICQQLTTQEIADRLFISPKTIETHKTNLLIKTGAKNSAGLIVYAIQHKLIDPAELVLISG
jgi:DNA-binding NarL/FixJ family response regulator